MAKYNSIVDAIYAKVDDFIEKGIVDKSAKAATIQECLNKISLLSLDNISNPEAAGALAEKNKEYDMVISDQIALLLESFLSTIDDNKNKDYDIRFIGMNGDVIYGYSKDEFLNLTKMPSNPKVEGFTSQGWNWDFEDAQAYVTEYGKLNVGQMYIPSDGKTHMVLDVGVRKTIPLMIQQTVSEGVTINWGDGSEEETIEGTGVVTTSHTYEVEGEYEITLDVAEGCTLDFGGTVDDTACNVFGESSTRIYISSLEKIYIGDSVTSIEQQVFGNCLALTSLTLPDGVTSIGQSAFWNCLALTSLTLPDGVTSIGQQAFGNCIALTSLTLPDSVTSIEQQVFANCYALTNLTLPDGVTSIGQQVFANCFALTSLTLPDSVTSIEQQAFGNCYALTNLTLPDGVTSIGQSAFWNCYALTNLTLPDGVTSIGQQAFGNCLALTSLTLPDGVTSIGQQAFWNCLALTNLTLPDGVTSIGQQVFANCFALTSLTLPDSVTSIEQQAFGNCRKLYILIILPETPPTLANVNAFTNLPSDCTIYVPHGKGDTYKAASGWSTWASQIQELPE